MKNRAALMLVLLAWAVNAHGQGSTVPDSVRAMIERSQSATQFEQTARMQVNVQFGDFLTSLAADPQKRSQVEAALIEVLSERAELSAGVSSGRVGASELAAVSDYSYLRERVAPLLNAAELSLLDSGRGGPSDAQLKREYAAELSRTAGGLTEANRELVLDIVIKHIRSSEADATGLGRLSVEDLVNQQSVSLMRAREELQSQLSGDQLQQANAFVSQLQANLAMNRAMLEAPQ